MAGAPPGGASTQDQRRERRVPFAARAVLHSGPTESQSRFVNFSESGCFIKTSGTLPPGSQVQLSFAMSGLVFRCSAIVRHSSTCFVSHRRIDGIGCHASSSYRFLQSRQGSSYEVGSRSALSCPGSVGHMGFRHRQHGDDPIRISDVKQHGFRHHSRHLAWRKFTTNSACLPSISRGLGRSRFIPTRTTRI
jgi:PilZ domain-containing protein